jgi:glycosyltransferase involved in cell wall biosynthesis
LDYWVVVVTRNGSSHIRNTIDSLLAQKESAKGITVVDDGSTDDTPNILREYGRINKRLSILSKPDHGYDIRRVPANINQAWAKNADLATEYFMISGDDCAYPTGYAAYLLARMQSNPRLVVASGRPTGGASAQEHSPSGSGRMVSSSFWRQIGSAYPVRAGWEAWLLFKATENGSDVKLFDDLTYEHARPRGAGHQFVYWGAAMSTLGYHPLYAFGRVAINALRPSLAPRRAVNMLRGYLQAELGSDDPFIIPYEPSMQSFVKHTQSLRIARIVSSIF